MAVTIGTSGGNKTLTGIFLGASGASRFIIEGWVGTSIGNKQFI
jgi:hypothetical protein